MTAVPFLHRRGHRAPETQVLPRGEDPYGAETSIVDAIKALGPEDAAALTGGLTGSPRPSFTPAPGLSALPPNYRDAASPEVLEMWRQTEALGIYGRGFPAVIPEHDPLRDTGEIPVLAEAQATVMREIRTSPDTQPQQARPDPSLMGRVLDGLRRMDRPSRVPAFAADRAQLPVFGGMVREKGWCGLHLHAGEGVPALRRMTADRWYAAQMTRIGQVTEMAQAEIRARAVLVDGIEAHFRTAADAAHLLGGMR